MTVSNQLVLPFVEELWAELDAQELERMADADYWEWYIDNEERGDVISKL